MQWDELEFWQSKEWLTIQENLDELESLDRTCNPVRNSLFNSLDTCPFGITKVMLIGQDPYPQHKYCTGLAFSIPKTEIKWPLTLCSLLGEYCRDLHYSLPITGDLTAWTQQGVLLWNAIPSCEAGKSMSHAAWPWHSLTKEIIQQLNNKPQGIVFAFLGGVAREWEQYADITKCHVITTSHPSPRGSMSSRTPFLHSRLFSSINDKLVQLGHSKIDWLLPGSKLAERA